MMIIFINFFKTPLQEFYGCACPSLLMRLVSRQDKSSSRRLLPIDLLLRLVLSGNPAKRLSMPLSSLSLVSRQDKSSSRRLLPIVLSPVATA